MAFPLGLMIVGILTIMLIFDVFSRTLDILKLKKRLVLIVLIAVMVGYFAPNIAVSGGADMNVGGFLIPAALGLILLGTVRSGFKWLKALSGIAAGTLIILAFGRLAYSIMGHAVMPITSIVLAGLLLGVVAFLTTREFKLALIVCLLASCIADALIYSTNIVGEYFHMNALGESAALSITVLGVCTSATLGVLFNVYEYRKKHKRFYAKNLIEGYTMSEQGTIEVPDIEPKN